MKDPIAERCDLAAGQFRHVGEADLLGPAHQVDRGQDDLEPGGVLVPCSTRQVAEPGGLGLADAVLDTGVLAVPQLQSRCLAGHHARFGIGQNRGDPMTVDIGERELGSRVGTFLAQDQPRSVRPRREVDHAGGLGHPGPFADVVAVAVIGLDRRMPAFVGDEVDDALDLGVEDVADLWALDRGRLFPGTYHVLGGRLSALEGVRPEDLSIGKLIERVAAGGIDEVVLAMNATLEGQTTAHYLAERLERFPVRITQLAHGLPVGGELDYLDEGTLAQALRARRPVA